MSQITIKSGRGNLTLKKSSRYVGLKTEKPVEEKDAVKKEVLPNLGGFNIVTLNKNGETIDEKLDEVREEADVDVGTHVYYVPGHSNRPLVPTGEIYIIFQESVTEAEQKIIIQEFNLAMVERRSKDRVIVKVTPNSPNPLKVAKALQGNKDMVRLAEPDLDALVEEYEFNEPLDTLFSHQWHLRNPGFIPDVQWPTKKGADAKVVDAWNRLGNTGSDDIVVAVIDNGFDINHPDLKSKVFKPFDLWTNSNQLEMNDPRFTHGTPCASVAVAPINGTGIVGSAPSAKFMPISGTSFSLRATEEMFNYCIENGADVISCSWGTTDPAFDLNQMKKDAIAKAAREGRNGKGCVICYAVGNDDLDYVSYYSAHPDVIAVAASTSKDKHADYSNRGREVTICAPSNGDWPITAARASWDEGISWETGLYRYWRDGRSRGTGYKHFGGTSSACPLVAGICALMLSANPDLTAKQVKDILCQTADKVGDPSEYVNGHSVKYGYGRVNADKAVAEAIRLKDIDAEPVEVVDTHVKKGRGIFRFTVEDQPPNGFGIQIGAFAEYGNVLIQAEKLQAQFNAPVIVSINELNGKTVYKMVLGVFDSKSEARTLLNRMKDKGVSGFIRAIKDLE